MLKRNDVPNMEISTPKFQARNRNIKCFLCLGVEHITSQCPNKRTMIVHVNRDVIHESEATKKYHSLRKLMMTMLNYLWQGML